MKKLLLLDADVILDLHTLGLFERIAKTYHLHVTRTVFGEAQYFKKDGIKHKIDIKADVSVIDDVALDSLQSVQAEAREAQLGIDPGELESIAFLSTSVDEIKFCTCDKSAIKLISYIGLETRSVSVEQTVRNAGHHKRNLYPRHFDKLFQDCVKEGKALRIQFKKLI